MREYLSEEELEQLIMQLEKQELYAPGNLKEKILRQALSEKQPESSALFLYRLKVIAGMAAALVMLVLIPLQDKEERQIPKWEEQADRAWTDENGEIVSMHVAIKESSQRVQQNVSSFWEWLQKDHQ